MQPWIFALLRVLLLGLAWAGDIDIEIHGLDSCHDSIDSAIHLNSSSDTINIYYAGVDLKRPSCFIYLEGGAFAQEICIKTVSVSSDCDIFDYTSTYQVNYYEGTGVFSQYAKKSYGCYRDVTRTFSGETWCTSNSEAKISILASNSWSTKLHLEVYLEDPEPLMDEDSFAVSTGLVIAASIVIGALLLVAIILWAVCVCHRSRQGTGRTVYRSPDRTTPNTTTHAESHPGSQTPEQLQGYSIPPPGSANSTQPAASGYRPPSTGYQPPPTWYQPPPAGYQPSPGGNQPSPAGHKPSPAMHRHETPSAPPEDIGMAELDPPPPYPGR